MGVIKIAKKNCTILLAVALFGASSFLSTRYEKPFIFITKQEDSLNFNDKFLVHYNLGLKRLISSTLWISTILESDNDHYKKKDLNSWMFLRFNTIGNLEPLFYENYLFGGTYLSIIKDDLEGASLIYDKGLSFYGDDFALLRDAGFHYYFEVQNYPKAYQLYSKLKNNPKTSPIIISSLARMEKSQGNIEGAYELLLNRYSQLSDKNSFVAERLRLHLYSLKAEIDLNCLNGIEKKICDTVDFLGNNYQKKNGSYEAIKLWEPFKITKKKISQEKN